LTYDGNLLDLEPLIDFLGSLFHGWIEFTLHDLSKPGRTIIAICNGEVTGRRVGDSLSDFTQKVICERVRTEEDFRRLKKEVLSASAEIESRDMLICGSDGAVRGILSVNISLTPLNQMQRMLDLFRPMNGNHGAKKNGAGEGESFFDLAKSIVEDVLAGSAVPVDRLMPEERQSIIAELKKAGVFQIKGIVSFVAQEMDISEASVYRYLGNL